MTDPIGNGIAAGRVAAAGFVAYEQYKFMKEQLSLSNKYLLFFQEQRQFYRTNWRPRTEDRVRQDATDPIVTPDYVALYGRAYNYTADIAIRFERLLFGTGGATNPASSFRHRRAAMYMLPAPSEVQLNTYISLGIAATKVDATTYRFRYEEYKENIMGQRRYDRLLAVAEYSNKSGMAVARDGATSFGYLNNALEAKGNMYGAMANDMFASAGNLFQSRKGGPKQHYNYPVNAKVGSYEPEQFSRRLENSLQSPIWESPTGGVVAK